MTALLAVGAFTIVMAVVIGDATVGATVAGVFSLINFVLSTIVMRRAGRTEAGILHTHKILTAPRRAVYDSDGQIIGTVIKLEDTWADSPVIPAQRADDPPPDERSSAP
jgi:hypothetical protein